MDCRTRKTGQARVAGKQRIYYNKIQKSNSLVNKLTWMTKGTRKGSKGGKWLARLGNEEDWIRQEVSEVQGERT